MTVIFWVIVLVALGAAVLGYHTDKQIRNEIDRIVERWTGEK